MALETAGRGVRMRAGASPGHDPGGRLGRLLARERGRVVRARVVLLVATLAFTGGSAAGLLGGPAAKAAAGEDLVRQWNQVALNSITDTSIPQIRRVPPVAARSLAIVHTAIYDAWAAYDPTADATNGASAAGSTDDQKLAISHAAYETLSTLFGARAEFGAMLAAQGSAPGDPAPAAQIGQRAAADILTQRAGDGANFPSYADPTNWSSSAANVNKSTPTPVVVTQQQPHVQPVDPNKWQPLINPDGTTQSFLVPHWAFVTPFAMTSGGSLRPAGPAVRLTGTAGGQKGGNGLVVLEVQQALKYSAELNDQTKSTAWYWSDGPGSVTPPGHWNVIAQEVSRRRGNTLGQDAKLFFALNNALLDAGIVAWDAKRAFNSMRPITAVRWIMENAMILAWKPNQGSRVRMPGQEWRPFLPTPPFAEYTSGHSTFSAAAAAVLRSFTGSDSFSFSATVAQGSIPSSIESGVPTNSVTLSWPSFTEMAKSAGVSRQIGGIHFKDGDDHARATGTTCGNAAYNKAKGYFKTTS